MIHPASHSKQAFFLFLVTFFVLCNSRWLLNRADLLITSRTSSPPSLAIEESLSSATAFCDLSRGRWIPDSRPPLYTNDTCRDIYPSQNCLQNARPDRGYLGWRWRPSFCELPPFDASRFLQLMAGKRLVLVGDSIARNHMQSLHCALSQVESPRNLYSDVRSKAFTWHFPSHNFTLANIWSPFLVNFSVEQDLYRLQLDLPDRAWTSQLQHYDALIISTGYWYFRPSLYYVNDTVLGANSFSQLNIAKVKLAPILKIALKNVFKHIAENYKGLVMLRTVTVDHFEHGSWNDGGFCNRTSPYTDTANLPSFPWMNHEINRVQIEEFTRSVAHLTGTWRHEILNVTYSAFLRPDGHPGPYRIQEPSEPLFDCLHWCLPGPIDMWNQLVLRSLEQYSRTLMKVSQNLLITKHQEYSHRKLSMVE